MTDRMDDHLSTNPPSYVTSDPLNEPLTRRTLLRRGAAAGGALLTSGGLVGLPGSATAAIDKALAGPKRGGSLRVGAQGGGTADELDAALGISEADVMRQYQLYEPLVRRSPDFSSIQNLVAESLEMEGKSADVLIVRIRPGIEFHNGKSITPEDVIFTLRRIADPKLAAYGASSLSVVDFAQLKKLDARTVRIPLLTPNAVFPDQLGQRYNGIVPVGYDPLKPIGSGPFAYVSFTPGTQSVFKRFANYWASPTPYVDDLTIIDLTEDVARVNALTSGQVDAIDGLPPADLSLVASNPKLRVLSEQTGLWPMIFGRADLAPFRDHRVRQALRLIVNRPQMIKQALDRDGHLGNDIYGRYDPDYNTSLPQRHQDIEQAKSLLKAAGQENLKLQLVTGPEYYGIEQQAEVFAQQAKQAGVTVTVKLLDLTTLYGANYFKWPFSQDYRGARTILAETQLSFLRQSSANEMHWVSAAFEKLYNEASATVDDQKRRELVWEMQRIQYEQGSWIIPYFQNSKDAYATNIGGVTTSHNFPLGDYAFKGWHFV